MDDAQQQLLFRVLGSVQFVNATSLKKILLFVCEKCNESSTPSLKEWEIATGALGRPNSFDPKLDPIVRVSFSAIRERLRSYFDAQGRMEALTLTIPKGEYRAVFSPSAPFAQSSNRQAPQALHRFWAPYTFKETANVLIYSDLLFFQDHQGNYVRNIYVNDPSADPCYGKYKLPIMEDVVWSPSYHFVSAGEVHAMTLLMQWFHGAALNLSVHNSRFSSWKELMHCNLLILGSPRINSFMASLQGGCNFVVCEDSIDNLAPLPCEQAHYSGLRYRDGTLERATEFALVTRQPGLSADTVITMIAANHGRAIEGAGQFLTVEDNVGMLLNASGVGQRDPLPTGIQFLLRVDMVDFDEEVINVEYVAHRIL